MLSHIIDIAKRVKRSDAFKDVIATPKRLAVRARQRTNRNIFSVEIESRCGFFAIMQMILFILLYCEEHDLIPDISAKGGLYGEPTGTIDWLSVLFESVRDSDSFVGARTADARGIRTSKIKDMSELGFRSKYEMELTFERASSLLARYYRPSPDTQAEVDATAKRLGVSESTLAVHYRGTDKVYESGEVPWSWMCEYVRKIQRACPHLSEILLATDEIQFIRFFESQSFGIPMMVAPAAYMPKNDKPVHFSGHPGLAIGREALVTCLLLARSGFLLKSPSYLSGWSKIFNPALPVWLISPPLGGGVFPDRLLWSDQQSGSATLDL
jgi:hypothetical protein